MSVEETRPVTVAIIQCPAYGTPASMDLNANLSWNLQLVDQACNQYHPDFVLLSELFMMPYFCATRENRFFDWAEPIPSSTTEAISRKAVEYGCHIIAPVFEKSATVHGEYYNSAVLIGDDGKLIRGILPDGTKVDLYRKTHLPTVFYEGVRIDEKYYFHPGPGLPVFDTKKGKLGILICWDRSFPESWRSLALLEAEMIFVSAAASGYREESFLYELRTHAMENGVYVFVGNRGGEETLDNKMNFFGCSCAIDPMGNIVTQAPRNVGAFVIGCTIDLAKIKEARMKYPFFRDRRPEIYRL